MDNVASAAANEDIRPYGQGSPALASAVGRAEDQCMSATSEPVAVLNEAQCWDLLSGVGLGRLVTVVAGQPEIFPVNFTVQRRTLLFRTGEGTKLSSTVINSQVVFEVDDHNDVEGWSVVVRGSARALHTSAEIDEAERAPLSPWIATEKHHFVRVIPHEVTGRRFMFGPEPDRQVW